MSRLVESRRLRAEGAQARVAHEMKKKADEVQAKKARKRERVRGRVVCW